MVLIRLIYKQQIDEAILTGCVQEHLAMPKVMPSSESASSQKWVELWSCFLHVARHPLKLKMYSVISSKCVQTCQNWFKAMN